MTRRRPSTWFTTIGNKAIKQKQKTGQTNLENENICDASEGDSQVDDLRLRHLVGDVPDVNHLKKRKIS
jgi:hypothetical protein